ncbi:MAG: cupin domain-containing protein [Candidatus Sulfotelmatobacter sp.]
MPTQSEPTRTLAFIVLLLAAILAAGQSQPKPHAKVVALDKADNGILPILTGPPETVTMKSGYVVLEPGRSVGKHSTEHHEEMLIILEGEGEMRFDDGSKLELKPRTALYCPPETEHDVWNTGAGTLRYVYVVANAR